MPRPKNALPTYRHHKPTNTARCWLNGRWVALGRYNTPESRAAFARILAELAAAPAGSAPTSDPTPAPRTVDDIILAFWKHAERHYRRSDGSPTNELSEYHQTFRVLRRLYGPTAAKDFGPLSLKAVREAMIGADWCRGVVNQRVNRIRRVFKWAAGEELVPFEAYQKLTAVAGLQRDRSRARETKPVEPVAAEHVRAVLPHIRPAVAAMIEVQYLTGMRPGEVCQLRPVDLDTTGDVWLFKPRQHKGRHRGKGRVVAIGPKAQAVLNVFTPPTAEGYYFSPRRAVADLHATRTANRKTPKYPSHMKRNATKRKAAPGEGHSEKYDASSYGQAIARGVEKANRALVEAAVEVELHVPHWHPHQLRHNHATEVRARYGLEAAGAALGHSKMSATEVYAERDAGLAVRVARGMG